ncbi:TPA: helix-turn-helix domain-containing protein [Bacillus cereus]|uniref:helix-turn-helix domain-containing protein n=1 Tax=Bacillus cereus TaxID=1396 RepID=UPI001F19AAB4|nr:helix-turn-helix domain-containing protein [Bacillus cereus]BCC15197.1 hypothetical protein BCM0074_p317 [Bacillus cereus]HDR6306416.1 helix-turn-helix domain-containing protein [Bacillus cereus]
MKKIEEKLVLQDVQILNNARKQIEFLKLIYPDATFENGYKDGTIEIRFLKRTSEGTRPLKSFNTWTLFETDIEYLQKTLSVYNGLPCCTYYSSYTFNRMNKTGEKSISINNENALHTSILAMDFDGIGEVDFLVQKKRLLDIGIETVDVFTGHGYQSIILLKEKSYDKELLKKFTELLLRKSFPVDSQIKDAARVLRLPYTYNCKAFLGGDKYYNPVNPEGIQTFVYDTTTKRYDDKWVFEQLEGLEDAPNELEEFFDEFFPKSEEIIPVEVPASKVSDDIIEEVKNEKKGVVFKTDALKEQINVEIKTKKEYEELYKHFNYIRLPEAIQNMLMGTPFSGIGNDTLKFLVPFLKNHLGLSLEKQIETLQTWGELCKPVWDKEEIKKEVKRLNKYEIKAQYGEYTENMQKVYGDLVFDKWVNDDEIIIMNEIFEKIKDITDGAFRLYLSIKLLVHEEKRSNFTNEEICERAEIAIRTFEKHIGHLRKQRLVGRKISNRSKGDKYEYYLNPYENTVKGFTKIKASLIELLFLKGLNDAQITFYLYLKHMVGVSEESCWASQTYIAKELGKKSQTTISKMTDELHKKKIIYKETKKVGKVVHSTYLLLK